MDKLREGSDMLQVTAKGVRNQLRQMLPGKWRQRDFRDLSAAGLDLVELAHERMNGSDFIIAIGTDQQEVTQFRARQQILQQIERCRIEPLQIIEEQRQRMFGAGKYAEEAPEHQLEAVVRLLLRQLRDR